MFNFFKRLVAPTPTPARKPSKRRRTSATGPVTEPMALPDVVEGNGQSDWNLWHDSVDALDSQMHSLSPLERTRGTDKQTPRDSDDCDPFYRVSKNSDL